jgi:hypothetical protein
VIRAVMLTTTLFGASACTGHIPLAAQPAVSSDAAVTPTPTPASAPTEQFPCPIFGGRTDAECEIYTPPDAPTERHLLMVGKKKQDSDCLWFPTSGPFRDELDAIPALAGLTLIRVLGEPLDAREVNNGADLLSKWASQAESGECINNREGGEECTRTYHDPTTRELYECEHMLVADDFAPTTMCYPVAQVEPTSQIHACVGLVFGAQRNEPQRTPATEGLRDFDVRILTSADVSIETFAQVLETTLTASPFALSSSSEKRPHYHEVVGITRCTPSSLLPGFFQWIAIRLEVGWRYSGDDTSEYGFSVFSNMQYSEVNTCAPRNYSAATPEKADVYLRHLKKILSEGIANSHLFGTCSGAGTTTLICNLPEAEVMKADGPLPLK